MKWYVLKSPSLSLEVRAALDGAGITYFLPTQEVMRKVGGVMRRMERPLVLNFLFLYGEQEVLKGFLRHNPVYRLAFVYTHCSIVTGEAAPLVVPDEEMRLFVRTVGAYKDRSVPYVAPTETDLAEGDLVRIVGGQFDGVEGVLLCQKGKEGGRVMVSVGNLLAVPTLDIEPQYLQILRYGKSKKHFYKHLDSYIPRLNRCLAGEGDLTAVRVFVQRYCALRTATLNAEAKLTVLLLASYRLLGDVAQVAVCAERLQGLLPKLKSEQTLQFVERYR